MVVEKIIVRKGLQSRCLSYCQAPALCWVVMNVVVAILHYVGCNCGGRLSSHLHPKSVAKCDLMIITIDAAMIWKELFREFHDFW